MTPDPAHLDPAALARTLVAENSYLTLATASADGIPWATPVWFAARDLDLFVWASKPGALHSLNIADNPRVSLVIFDSTKAPGEGSALYVAANAELAADAAFDEALAVYNMRSVERGLPEWDPSKLLEPARHRLYRAVTIEAFVLDDHDERIKIDRPVEMGRSHS